MKILTAFCLLFLTNAYLDAADPTVHRRESRDIKNEVFAYASTAYKHENRELTHLEKETFDLLKKKFPSELLNKNLETLRELSDSDAYINFLSKKYPEQAPFTSFQDVFYKVLPPNKELYFNLFFKKQLNVQTIENVEDDEFYVAYAYMATNWAMGAYERGGDLPPSQRPNSSLRIGQYIIAKTPKGNKLLELRLGIKDINIDAWGIILTTFEPLLWLGTPIREEDERWIKNLFDKHGQSDGLLRLVVQDPMLFDRILYAFSTDTTFLKWLYDAVDVDAKLHERWRRLDGKHEDRELTPLEQETFDLLKKKFPGELLDKDLKTLRAIAESPEYMDGFLPKVYPNSAPFIDFDDFDRTVMPPKERYLGFCREYLNIEKASEITDDEQYVVHHIATSAWANEASQRGGDDPPNQQKDKPFRLGQVMAFKPIGRNILERRSADPAAFAFVLLTSRDHLNEDIRWIKTLFDKHGISDGCLHIALQDPILFYRILYAFSTNTSFLKCLYDPIGTKTKHQK
ncbi:hypothetical protein F4009_24665 [Candidatus Poribacteria bacterium]|nr:hypothetical protein [Candidatus Poribacteria bacterium]MYH82321.1 hypothetical protein [Candidatus Poribacteria bacterium]MYK97150.1 hypothetical protein [Candidatus Poribacteria bacterium]